MSQELSEVPDLQLPLDLEVDADGKEVPLHAEL